ncbi:unnamed protein product [Sphagnum balticum]
MALDDGGSNELQSQQTGGIGSSEPGLVKVSSMAGLCIHPSNSLWVPRKTQLLSLLCLGEIERRKDLSAYANIEGVVIGSFQSPSKEIKAAASYALGNITVGNLAQYLLLHSLKEDRTASSSAFTRATVVIAIKYTIVERPQPIDAYKKPCIASFLITDDDRHVRRAAMSTLSTAAHNKPELVKDLLPTLLPLLYDQTVVKKELIRIYDLGPFKHIVDDGLELRKGVFECMDTLLDSCLDQTDLSSSPHFSSLVMDALVNPLEKSMTNKTKPDVVKQEVDHNEDMTHSGLHAIDSLNWINSELTTQFKAFMNNVQKSGSLADKYSIVRHESDTVGGGDAMDFN